MSAGNDWGDGRHLVDDAVGGLLDGLDALGVRDEDVSVVDWSPPGPFAGVRRVRVAGGASYLVSVCEVRTAL